MSRHADLDGGASVLMVLLNSTGKNTRLGDAHRIRQWLEGPKPGAARADRKRRESDE